MSANADTPSAPSASVPDTNICSWPANPHVERLRELEILWQGFEIAEVRRAALFALDDDEQADLEDKYRDRVAEVSRTEDKIRVVEEVVLRHREWRAQRLLERVAILRAHHLEVQNLAIVAAASMSRTTLYNWLPRTQEFIEKLRTDAVFVLTDPDASSFASDLGAVLICTRCDVKFAVGVRVEISPEDEAAVSMCKHWETAHDWRTWTAGGDTGMTCQRCLLGSFGRLMGGSWSVERARRTPRREGISTQARTRRCTTTGRTITAGFRAQKERPTRRGSIGSSSAWSSVVSSPCYAGT